MVAVYEIAGRKVGAHVVRGQSALLKSFPALHPGPPPVLIAGQDASRELGYLC